MPKNKKINAIKMGNTVNLSIDGKLYKKVFNSIEESNALYKAILVAKENPTDENIKKIRMYLNEKLRKALIVGVETDIETGEAFLDGFNTPIPESLLDIMIEYHNNGFPLDAIVNFWKLLMINPDTRIRTSLFDFIKKHDFVLTDNGYMIVYKAVYKKESDNHTTSDNSQYFEFISNKWLHVKKTWKCNPNKYAVYMNNSDGTYDITKVTTAETWNEKEKDIEILGKLGDLYSALILEENNTPDESSAIPMYTDMYTREMSITIGNPVLMDRKDCDSDPAIDCSYGLHVGATNYVSKFANSNSIILACYVNPANVVAVPNYDNSKMRVTEYFPFAVASYENNEIDIVEQKYFEDDYCQYELDELEEMVAKVKANELPIPKAIHAKDEDRPMSELLKIIETRILDLV